MKISREQKELNRKALITSAVEMMAEEGLKNATMRRIAQRAGLSEPVIYKYFPSKDHIIASYFAGALDTAIKECEAQADFNTLSFGEQIHMLFDAQVAVFEQHREFVDQAFKHLFLTTLSGSMTYLADQRKRYTEYVDSLLEAAVSAEEFPLPPGRRLVGELLWDFHLGMTYYWLSDPTTGSQRTLQMLDKSLALFTEILRSNVLSRVVDLFYFLSREHFLKAVDNLVSLTDDQKERKARFLGQEKKKKPTH